MHIKNVSLRNFKCFEKVDVNFSKITLLTGPNSSGKSSLMYGLLGPLQTGSFPFYFSPNGKYVNMGDYTEMVFNNLKSKRIQIDIVVGGNDKANNITLTTSWIPDIRSRMPKLCNLKATFPHAQIEISSAHKDAYILKLNYDPKKFFKEKSSAQFMKKFYDLLQKLELPASSKKKKSLKVSPVNVLESCKIRGRRFNSLENLIGQVRIVDFLMSFLDHIKTNVNFISSFRLQPDRTYYQVSPGGKNIGKYGENYVDQIIEWEKRKSDEFKWLQSGLRQLKLLSSLKSKKLAGGRFELRVKVKRGGVWSLLTDVGFGISQFLPVIVADLQLASSSTLFVAQPEIHLHPNAQACLGDYFVERAKNRNKRYVVETHSEYLMNRIRLAITKKDIKPSDVSVYYFENTRAGTNTCKVEFTKDGQIKNAPPSFFDTYMMDVMDIAMNAH